MSKPKLTTFIARHGEEGECRNCGCPHGTGDTVVFNPEHHTLYCSRSCANVDHPRQVANRARWEAEDAAGEQSRIGAALAGLLPELFARDSVGRLGVQD